MLELLLKLEMSLWINETRGNYDYLNKILHQDFKEFGVNGSVNTKQNLLTDLPTNIQAVFPFENMDVKQLNEHSFLVTYQAKVVENSKVTTSNHSSIWVGNDSFQLIFHQGTLTK